MSFEPVLRDLRNILVELCRSEDELGLMLDDAGIPPSRIPRGSTLELTWHNALRDLHASRDLARLLEVAVGRYSNRSDLEEAAGRYRVDIQAEPQRLPRELLRSGDQPGTSPIARGSGPLGRDRSPELLLAGPSLAGQPSAGSVVIDASGVVLDPPDLPRWASPRRELVGSILERAGNATLLYIQGEACTGKTWLARLVADRLALRHFWVRLSAMDDERAAVELDRAFYALTGTPPAHPRGPWYDRVCEQIGDGGVLVVDDAPELAGVQQFWLRLGAFLTRCHASGMRVVVTGLYPLPHGTMLSLDDIPHHAVIVAPLTDGECGEIMGAFGAPREFVSGRTRFVSLFCRRHPFLFAAACDFLRRREWRLGAEEFDAIVGGQHAGTLVQDVNRRLRATVPDPDTRKLLYRLSLIGDRFPAELADQLASVNPPIDRPRERLRDLTGPWVSRNTRGTFETSPLLAQVGREQLSETRRVNCHRRIGLALARGRMDQHTASMAIAHLVQAAEFDKAGTLLMLLLAAALRERLPFQDDVAFSIWRDTPLPARMEPNLRLILRGLQVAVSARLGRPLEFLLGDLDALVERADGAQRMGLAGAASYIAMAVTPEIMPRACRYLQRLIQMPQLPSAARKDRGQGGAGRELSLRDDFPVELLLFLLLAGVDGPQLAAEWIEVIASLSPERRRGLFLKADHRLSFPAIGDFLITAELRNPEPRRDWRGVLANLDRLAARASELGVEELQASLVRTKILVLAGQLRLVGEAEELARRALSEGCESPVSQFLIRSAIGERLLLAGDDDRARQYLTDELLDEQIPPFHEKMVAMLAASRAVAALDPEASITWAERAVSLAVGLRGPLPLEEVKALAELGIAVYLHRGAAAAFSVWDRAAERLFSARGASNAWKELFVVFGHATGYLASEAGWGRPPSQTGQGDEYAPPERGMFLVENAARLDFFRDENTHGIAYLLSSYASSVEALDRASFWRGQIQPASGGVISLVDAAVARDEVTSQVIAVQIPEILEGSRRACRIMVASASTTARAEPRSIVDPILSEAVPNLSADQLREADQHAVVMGIIPAVLRIATLYSDEAKRPAAVKYARDLVAACRSLPDSGTDHEYWEGVARSVEVAFVDCLPSSEIRSWRDSQRGLGFERDVVILLGLAAHSMVEDALGIHLPLMRQLFPLYPPRTEVYRRLLLPYVERFWSAAFRNMRFRFPSPNLVATLLDNALREPQSGRLRAVLRAVSAGSTRGMPDDLKRWLNERD